MGTNYAGIDYGMGRSNIDTKTDIRYGVISQNEVLQAWADSSEPVYLYSCPECEMDLGNELFGKCPHCGYEFEDDDFEFCEPINFSVENAEYVADCGDDGDIFITKSPYFTYAQFCSPCAPGAGYLMNPFVYKMQDPGQEEKVMDPERYPKDYITQAELAGFPRVYCFGHDWFEEGKAPYPVFSVKFGGLVLPNKE